MKYVNLLILLIIFVVSCNRPEDGGNTDRSIQASRLLNEAVALARSGQSDQALTTIDKALALDPDWIALYYNQAIVYSVKGLKDKEENSYNEVIRRAGKASRGDKARYLSAAYYNLAFIDADRSQPGRAFANLEKALKLAADVNIYYHDLVSNQALAALRSDRRFVALMRQYWPGFSRQTGRFPIGSSANNPDK